MIRRIRISAGSLVLLVNCLGLSSCARSAGPARLDGPPTVSVAYPIKEKITDYEHFTGRTAAPDAVEVRARVSGYLDKINFKEGAEVKEGEVLYEIDPRPYQAALNQARAQVTLQQAQLKYNEAVYQRNVRLSNAGQAVSLEEVQQSRAQRDTTEASLEAARAAVRQAELNLEWTKITSPIAGRVGRTLITRGNLVVADQTLLTTIVSLDPIFAYFDVDEQTMLRIQRMIREGKFKSAREGAHVPVYLGLAIEHGYPHEGYVDFVNNAVDLSTGTLLVRGVFANPKPPVGDRVLSAGLFVRIRVPIGPPYEALLVNQRVLGADQSLRYVYVVDEQDRVVRRDVTLGRQHGELQVVTEGISVSDPVVVNGLQHVRPGIHVKPELVDMPTAPARAQPRANPSARQGPAPSQTNQ